MWEQRKQSVLVTFQCLIAHPFDSSDVGGRLLDTCSSPSSSMSFADLKGISERRLILNIETERAKTTSCVRHYEYRTTIESSSPTISERRFV